ncbi:amphoterin-induced protein 3-like [Scleropages formosus]|uniref:Amphoterin-induced protein 3-like n=1 Tax=Scleropages formosus TaxID=113540 RepID=A0A0P7XM28_SCLFO|nr:amphoterin-induced protein 3-like [Scleropages formosus]
MTCAQGVAGLVTLIWSLSWLAEGSCPAGCLCASDIVSCGALGLDQLPAELPASAATLDLSHNRLVQLEDAAFSGLPRLESLRLSHNRLSRISPGTFRNATTLRHLDLSSNELHVVEQHYFQELVGLEELLLFNNRIVRVESKALSSLSRLRRAYLSHNRLTDFPFFSIQEHSHPFLATLDLSSNRMSKLPMEDIAALPTSVQSGLFLHNNTLICECSMYSMFRHWEQKDFGSARDYREDYTCLVYGERRASIRFFQHGRFFENCTLRVQGLLGEPKNSLQAFVGEAVLLHCQTSLQGRTLSYLWVSPNQEYIAPPGNNDTLRMFSNGSLEIIAAKAEDSGVYWCMALDRQQQRNETREVNVTVVTRRIVIEPFNTGFTTLLGCVVSLVLVLMYLYLTPCRCWCRKQPPPGTPSPANECSAQSSILTPTPPATTEGPGRKVGNSKHVVFLEPIKEVQNGRLRSTQGPEHPKLQQLRGDNDSITSVFSDTPIVP